MKKEPFVIERTYNAPVTKVWEALTDKEKMKQWYFDVDDFKPEPGFQFHFYGEKDGEKFLHVCIVTEVVTTRKLAYSWCYKGYPGESLLTWELFAEGDKTRLKLTHAGLETFTVFTKEDFNGGWSYFIETALPRFVEEDTE